MKAIPGVESVAITDSLPFELGRSWDLRAKGRAHKDGDNLGVMVSIVTPGYLQTMGMRLKAGRDFAWDDSAKSDLVIIINQAAARREWPGQDPIGKLAQGIGDKDTRVVGVIDDVHETSAEEAASPSVFVPVSQSEPEKAEVVMRSTLPPQILAPVVLQRLRAMNPEQAIVPLKPVQVLIDRATAPRKFFAVLVGIFAVLGLILASLGIYGVTSYAVAQQMQEIGIRMALGATRERVRTEVMVRTLKIATLGIAIGTAASLVVARGIQSLLFATTAGDPVPFVGMMCCCWVWLCWRDTYLHGVLRGSIPWWQCGATDFRTKQRRRVPRDVGIVAVLMLRFVLIGRAVFTGGRQLYGPCM